MVILPLFADRQGLGSHNITFQFINTEYYLNQTKNICCLSHVSFLHGKPLSTKYSLASTGTYWAT